MNFDYSVLLPPHWKSIYLPLWFGEDFSGLDVTAAIVGNEMGSASLFLKSPKVKMKSFRSAHIGFLVLNCRLSVC
jgi:hypothetical protein